MRKSLDDRMLSVAESDRVQRRHSFCLDQRAALNIEATRAWYAEALGREVSASLVVRRALELLSVHLISVTNAASKDWSRHELAELTSVFR